MAEEKVGRERPEGPPEAERRQQSEPTFYLELGLGIGAERR